MTDASPPPPPERDRPTVLQSKWRPLIGWASLASFVYQAGGHQIANGVSGFLTPKSLGLIDLDPSTMLFVTAVLLGLAGLRTTEKMNGVAES